MVEGKKGKVYLVGAGPGDPGLFTLKGKKILERAGVVIYDRLVSATILSYCSPAAQMIYVGKKAGDHALPQEEINRLMVFHARLGKTVVRLKGGDPYLYGRGGEEALYLRENGCDFEVVPGITSAIAVPAYAGIPVTHRDLTSSFAIITGHEKPGKKVSSIKWDKISTGIGTLVFLMGLENLDFITANLIQNGRDPQTPIAVIRWGTTPEQEVLCGTLENIGQKVQQTGVKPPALIVIGEVVKLREHLDWLQDRLFWGKRIVVTRARAQASQLLDLIEELGGEAIEFPSIEIVRNSDLKPLYQCLEQIDQYDWIVFTSVNAVQIFYEELIGQKIDIRELKGIKIAAIGPATARSLEEKGLRVELVPEEYRAEAIITALRPLIRGGETILLPRAAGAREILPETLMQWGVRVDEVILYRAEVASRISEQEKSMIARGEVDYITFTSSSTVVNFVQIIGADNIKRINEHVKIACIGPITADTARQYGFDVDIIAAEYTIPGLLEAIKEAEAAAKTQ